MITLYQFRSCPFCSKVRALLNFSKTPYQVVEVSPRNMKELKGITDHKKVPVLTDDDKVIVESAAIIEYINDNYAKLPVTEDDKKWTDWVDNKLVHYLPPLIHPDFKTSYENIKKISPSRSFLVPLMGALIMPKVARRMKEKHNIKNPRKEFHEAIDYWVKEGLKGQQFYGGDTPSFVDCSVFGVLRSGHQLSVIRPAMQHNKFFAIWYDKCYPMMSGDRVSNPE